MKIIATLLIVTAALTAAPATSQASDCYTASYCAPTLLRICEVGRCCESRTGYDHCGNAFRFTVTIVTYRSHYSDGSTLTFTKTYGA